MFVIRIGHLLSDYEHEMLKHCDGGCGERGRPRRPVIMLIISMTVLVIT